MARTKSPLVSTVMLLEELKQFPNGITAVDLSLIVGRPLSGRLSKLYDYGVIDRTLIPGKYMGPKQYLYRTRLPKVSAPPVVEERGLSVAPQQEQRGSPTNSIAPPAADVESSSVASEPAGVE